MNLLQVRLREFFSLRPNIVADYDNVDGAIQIIRDRVKDDGNIVRSEFYIALTHDTKTDEFYNPLGFENASMDAIDSAIAALHSLKKKITLENEGIVPANELFERYNPNKHYLEDNE